MLLKVLSSIGGSLLIIFMILLIGDALDFWKIKGTRLLDYVLFISIILWVVPIIISFLL